MEPIFFYASSSPLSNFYPAPFTVEEITFPNSECFFMYKKAMYFSDRRVAQKILEASSPAKCKALGRTVKRYKDEEWADVRYSIMVDGLIAKFSQNPDLKEYLLQTGSQELVEASPTDTVWGIGLSVETAKNTRRKYWPGENLLGKALMMTRTEIRVALTRG